MLTKAVFLLLCFFLTSPPSWGQETPNAHHYRHYTSVFISPDGYYTNEALGEKLEGDARRLLNHHGIPIAETKEDSSAIELIIYLSHDTYRRNYRLDLVTFDIDTRKSTAIRGDTMNVVISSYLGGATYMNAQTLQLYNDVRKDFSASFHGFVDEWKKYRPSAP